MHSRYADLDEALRRYLADSLEARLVLCEFRRTGLDSVLDSPFITPKARAEAMAERDAVLIEWGEVMTELAELGSFVPL